MTERLPHNEIVERVAQKLADHEKQPYVLDPGRWEALARVALALADWQPIETAPGQGVSFLAYQPKGAWPWQEEMMGVGSLGPYGFRLDWVDGHDCERELENPTHWMPLPAPPVTAEPDGAIQKTSTDG